MEGAARIVVSRPLNGIFAFRRLTVRLDGAVVATLFRGREAELKVDPGSPLGPSRRGLDEKFAGGCGG